MLGKIIFMDIKKEECSRCGEVMEENEDGYLYCKYCLADKTEEYELPRDVKTGLDSSNYFDN